MSLSPALQASVRSAYRSLLRSSAITFAGDRHMQDAFRTKMRTEVIPDGSQTDPEIVVQKVNLTREISEFLRKNVAQARKVSELNDDGFKETWQLRLTEYNELGDNESVKHPPPTESSRSARKRKSESSVIFPTHDTASSPSDPNIPRFYSQLKKAHKERIIPALKEGDLEESFVRGSGPGGQSINKTENNVQLLHKPTGIRVTCQETRSLTLNRKYARRILLDKLDALYNPGLSKQEVLKAKQIEKARRRRKKAKQKDQENKPVNDR